MIRYLQYDCHVHSENSPDAKAPVSLLCEEAQGKGLAGITVTDHCECNLYWRDGYDKTIRQSFTDICRCRKTLDAGFSLYAGIELGQPLQDLAAAEDALRANPYDFVLCSLHNLHGEEDFYYIDYRSRGCDPHALLQRYFEELYEICRWGQFDSLAHLTYPVRYITGRDKISVDLSRYMGQIEEILKLLVQKGKALELNVSGLRQEIADFIPPRDIVLRFFELGGELITLGTDSHASQYLGKGISEGLQLLREVGFRHYAVFVQRNPKLVLLGGSVSD